jgi:catechol 2,3-dioxygenase-like lactoylglutathione lyase family enzyme
MVQDRRVFRAHHCTLSVSDLDRSVAFYGLFGFRVGVRWKAPDGALEIVHLVLSGFVLEVFGYASNVGAVTPPRAIGNDLEVVGVKHFAVQVASLDAARSYLLQNGIGPDDISGTTRGRTGIDYFFVRDPDGLWVEVVEDHRGLVREEVERGQP